MDNLSLLIASLLKELRLHIETTDNKEIRFVDVNGDVRFHIDSNDNNYILYKREGNPQLDFKPVISWTTNEGLTTFTSFISDDIFYNLLGSLINAGCTATRAQTFYDNEDTDHKTMCTWCNLSRNSQYGFLLGATYTPERKLSELKLTLRSRTVLEVTPYTDEDMLERGLEEANYLLSFNDLQNRKISIPFNIK